MKLHLRDTGGAGPPVVLLHGGGLDLHTWDAVIDGLPECRCVALDQRGHGSSAWTGAYDLADYVGDIAETLDDLGLERPVLVGHSMGGRNALGYVVDHAPDLQGLVLVDVTAERADTGPADRWLVRAREMRPPDARYDPLVLSAEGVGTHRDQAAALADRLDRVTCPTVVVHGTRSRIITEAEAVAFAEALPDGELVVLPGVGHNVQRDAPEELARIVRRLIP